MVAAIYARKSTDQAGVSEDARSVTRQVDQARAYATGQGWTVAADQVYVDDGVSGAEFGARRPGFLRLMNALTPRPPFQVLVMSEESRLGRESIETAYALKQLITAGVRVFFYLERRERTLNSPIDKAMLALQTMADEMERDKARQRTADAMLRKAHAGQVTGGRLFGYDNACSSCGRVIAPGAARCCRGAHTVRVISPAEAAVVRRAFALCAEGHGSRGITLRLNDEGALAPRPRAAGAPVAWSTSSVWEVLRRDLYRGRIVYNRTRKRDAWGRRKQTERASAEWVTVEAPDLRIVSEGLWQAAHAHLAKRRAAYGGRRDPDPWARPAVRGPKATRYLLAGLARCGVCGGGFISRSRAHGSTRQYRYGCGCNWTRGRRGCVNAREVLMDRADTAIRRLLEQDVLRAEVLDQAIAVMLDTIETRDARRDRRRDCDTAIAALDRELVNLTAAIASGAGDVSALVAGLRERQARREALAAERAALGTADAARWDRETLEHSLRETLATWRAGLDRPGGARKLLETILDGRIVFTPAKNAHGFDAYHVRVPLELGRLFEAELPIEMASPTGFEPVFQP